MEKKVIICLLIFSLVLLGCTNNNAGSEKNLNADQCAGLATANEINSCYLVDAVKTLNFERCSMIKVESGELQKIECYDAVVKAWADNNNACKSFSSINETNDCYTQNAVTTLSFKPCEKIDDSFIEAKNHCFEKVVWQRVLHLDCSQIGSENYQDFCNLLVSREIGSKERCNLISSPVLRDQCYTELLNYFDKLPEKNLCDEVKSNDYKSLCQYVFKQKMDGLKKYGV
jgi:hypothetical protein